MLKRKKNNYKVTTITLTEDTYKRLDKFVEDNYTTRSSVIEELINNFLEKLKS